MNSERSWEHPDGSLASRQVFGSFLFYKTTAHSSLNSASEHDSDELHYETEHPLDIAT